MNSGACRYAVCSNHGMDGRGWDDGGDMSYHYRGNQYPVNILCLLYCLAFLSMGKVCVLKTSSIFSSNALQPCVCVCDGSPRSRSGKYFLELYRMPL